MAASALLLALAREARGIGVLGSSPEQRGVEGSIEPFAASPRWVIREGRRATEQEEAQVRERAGPAGAAHRAGDQGPPGYRRPRQLERARERGEHGTFSYQLILDDGAAEFVVRVTADDAKVLRDWFQDADTVYFDMEREVLIFGEIT